MSGVETQNSRRYNGNDMILLMEGTAQHFISNASLHPDDSQERIAHPVTAPSHSAWCTPTFPPPSRDDPQKLIVELEAARTRADELASEVEEARRLAEDISESIFNARKKSLQEQQVSNGCSRKGEAEGGREWGGAGRGGGGR